FGQGGPRAAVPSPYTADRGACLGGGALDGRCGAGLAPCFAIQLDLRLGPKETRVLAFLLGHAKDEAAGRDVVLRLREPRALDASLGETRGGWESLLQRVRIETPTEALDLMVNGWLLYQALACR